MKRRFCYYTAAVLLASCNGGGGDGSSGSGSGCVGSFAGSAQVTSSTAGCPLCTISSPSSAIDGNPDSAASIQLPAGGGAVSLRATAQGGVVFPQGNYAGALMARPSSAQAAGSWTFNTYLGGVLQESGGGESNLGGGTAVGDKNYRQFKTTKQFDAVEISINMQSADATPWQVYEFCAQ